MDPSTGYGFVPTQRNDTYAAIDPLKSNLRGKYVLITGAARGLGRAMAISYAKAGASGIAILDLLDSTPVERDLLEAAKTAGRSEPKLISLVVDVTDESSVAKAVKIVQSEFDRLDIVINNAGWMAAYTPIGASDPVKWWRCWEVNVKGPYLIARGFLPLLLNGREKTIIVLSSVSAHFTLPGGSAYETTKLAVLKINNYLMAEYGSQGLLAYAVAPGGVMTDMAPDFPSQYHDRLTDTPQMVADTIVFLTKERREWLACRYVDSRWDMEEFLGRKEAIIRDDLLKVRMQVRLNVQAYRKRKKTGKKVDEGDLRWVPNTRWQNTYQHQTSIRQSSSNSRAALPGTRLLTVPVRAHVAGKTTLTHGDVFATPRLSNPARAYTSALLATFPERFLPTQVSLPETDDVDALRTPCALWITTAVKQAREPDSGALNDILHSIVLAIIGLERDGVDNALYARQLYLRSLTKIRGELAAIIKRDQHVKEGRMLNLFLSCHAATVYELLVNGSMPDMLRHVLGIGFLIEHLYGLPQFPRLLGHCLLEEYRTLEIQFCLLERRLSTANRLRSMERSGRMTKSPSGVASSGGIIGGTRSLQRSDISSRSPACRRAFFTFSSPRTPSDSAHHVDVARAIHYDYAICYLFSLSFDLRALETWIDAAAALDSRGDERPPSISRHLAEAISLRTQLLGIAGGILELLPFFLQDDKGIIGRSMPIWPLEIAWSMLERESDRSTREDETYESHLSCELKHQVNQNNKSVAKYFTHCERIARKIRAYGLSLVVERPVVQESHEEEARDKSDW
ncbi:uncharacterized protein Z518_10419 [Rhinocladiella mackenziei CBS 650.93]|uniref:Uncharacterized protein n=1 Tax=Rhinocladiella mackenziei CBS 650.93 TaxID=1442369 RepID=A0A0D2IU66_9EURO|nr:uncharacterized protein Z518_10419 [Rhinocladiella mackenziei CBS 650.93]KIX00280.1 hypothetical protein Z518_10419 [Rhinocladiella mackenziei CBS 650.93]